MQLEVLVDPTTPQEEWLPILAEEASMRGYGIRRTAGRPVGFEHKILVNRAFSEKDLLSISVSIYKIEDHK